MSGSGPARYDRIGAGYATRRTADPRIAAAIHRALGPARTVLNVGAGSGSYEPADRQVTAVEPSAEMIAQRLATAAPVVQARAEALPFGDDSFEASMAVLTVHHWTDPAKGVREMRRVTKGAVVILTFDPSHGGGWLGDYFPQLRALDAGQAPAMSDYARWLGPVETSAVAVPHDCADGFLYAYWRRPEAYLDADVRRAMSSFHAAGDVAEGLGRLRRDLESGAWVRRYGHLLDLDALDAGYRLVRAP